MSCFRFAEKDTNSPRETVNRNVLKIVAFASAANASANFRAAADRRQPAYTQINPD
jgi:hypothetical protein